MCAQHAANVRGEGTRESCEFTAEVVVVGAGRCEEEEADDDDVVDDAACTEWGGG
jgi:hypothetical protein